jgi:hypothetical protein
MEWEYDYVYLSRAGTGDPVADLMKELKLYGDQGYEVVGQVDVLDDQIPQNRHPILLLKHLRGGARPTRP